MPNTPCVVGEMAAGYCVAAATDLARAATLASDRAVVHALLAACGTAVEVEERLMDAVTGVSGSGPVRAPDTASVDHCHHDLSWLTFCPCFCAGTRSHRRTCFSSLRRCQTAACVQVCLGLLPQNWQPKQSLGLQRWFLRQENIQVLSPKVTVAFSQSAYIIMTYRVVGAGALKDQVTSPGGTTIAAVHQLEIGGMRGSVMNAVLAAAEKSKELGQTRTKSS